MNTQCLHLEVVVHRMEQTQLSAIWQKGREDRDADVTGLNALIDGRSSMYEASQRPEEPNP